MQHHSLTLYTDAEGIHLLKEQWQYADNNGVYLAALDECYTTALLNGGPQRYFKEITWFSDRVHLAVILKKKSLKLRCVYGSV